jgi:hypothetical protein
MHAFPVRWSCGFAVIFMAIANVFAAADEAKSTGAQLNCGARIERVTADGTQRNRPPMLILSDDSISCPLREGNTTFVVALPHPCTLERLKFVNENTAARGTLRIAVSNENLPPESGGWQPVDGSITFEHKRLFNLSVVGVEAKFVRVTFTVESEVHAANFALALRNFDSARRGLLGAYVNEMATKQTAFEDNFVSPNARP